MSENDPSLPRLILCDVGDTLIHLASYDRLAGLEAIRMLADAPERFDTAALAARGSSLDDWFEERVRPANLEYRQAAFLRTIAGLHGIRLECDDDHLEWLYWRSALRFTLAERVEEALERVSACGVELGIVSNTVVGPYSIECELERHGLADLFLRPIITSAWAGIRKPEALLFELALGVLGGEASTTWYVGNSPANDIAGAQAAGMRSVLYTPGIGSEPRTRIDADLEIDSWDELATLIEQLSAR